MAGFLRADYHRKAMVAGMLVLAGSAGIQVSAAIAASLFTKIGPLGVSGLRMLIAAGFLILVSRPKLRMRTRAEWFGISLFGVAMAAMNVCLYSALEHLPLGVAVTLEFLGPFTVALLGVRRPRDGFFALLALFGVILIGGPSGEFDPVGFGLGLGAAVSFGAYTLLAGKVGERTDGIDGLALSVAVAATVLLPYSIPAVPGLDSNEWLLLAVSGIFGVAFAFTADVIAIRLTSPRVAGVLFSIDPAMGSLVGALALGQILGLWTLVGITCVAISGGVVTWRAGRTPPESSRGATPSIVI